MTSWPSFKMDLTNAGADASIAKSAAMELFSLTTPLRREPRQGASQRDDT
jgi:hypothetical protein